MLEARAIQREIGHGDAAQPHPAIDELRQQMVDMARAITRLDPRNSFSSLEAAIHDLGARVDNSRQGGVKEAILRPIEDLIAEMQQSLAHRGSDPQLDTIERELNAISHRMDQFGQNSSGDDPRLKEIHQQTSSIKELLSAAVARPLPVEKIERQINALGKRIDLIASRGSSPVGAAAVNENVDEIRAALQQPYQSYEISTIQDRIEELSGKFDELIAQGPANNPLEAFSERLDAVQASIFQRLDQPSDEVTQTARKLEGLMLEIRDRLDVSAGQSGANAQPDKLEEHIRSLAQKIDTVSGTANTGQLTALEDHIRALAEKIDSVAAGNAGGPDNTALAALETQVREIAERIDHPNVSLSTLSTIEQTMTDLLNQIEETRLTAADAAENAARNATREALDEMLTRGALANVRNEDSRDLITREISGLRTAQEAKDQRTQATLSAVHETLEKVVDRLAMLEDNIDTRPAVAHARHGSPAADAGTRGPVAEAGQSLASGPAPLFERRPPVQPTAQPASNDKADDGLDDFDFAMKAAPSLEPQTRQEPKGKDRTANDKPDSLQLSPAAASLWHDSDDDELLEPGSGYPSTRTPSSSDQNRLPPEREVQGRHGAATPVYDDFDDDDDDLDLDAMSSGHSGSGKADSGKADSSKSSSSFIAAARRASIAAQAEAEAAANEKPRKKARNSSENTLSDARARAAAAAASLSGKLERNKKDSAEAKAGPTTKRAALRNRKVLLSLGLAAAVLVLGTLQFLRTSGSSNHTPDVITPKAPISRPATPATPGKMGKATNSAANSTAHSANPGSHEASPRPGENSPNTRPPGNTLQNGAMLNRGFSHTNGFASNSNRFVKQPAAGTDRTAVASIPAPASALAKPASNRLADEAQRGNASAQYELALRYIAGRTIPRDYDRAVALLEKASAQGLAQAQYRLGSLYEKGIGTKKDPARALYLYERAGNAGNIRAMHNYAVLAAEGAAGKPDYAKAAQWFQKAAEHGVRDSQYNLAILYARGLGISRSMSKSYIWFSIAASQGDKDAASKRDQVARKMSQAETMRAKQAIASFKPHPRTAVANSVVEPKGGWVLDAAAIRSLKTSGAPKVDHTVPVMVRRKMSRI
ncbi:MAG: SEL1-like repeat protein [Hyphomicrobiales bacterium]|nr:SEL1-like repeat protein [Hyphomicrobiales bacterium]